MAALSHIAVLLSVGRNPVSGAPRCSRNDVLALDLARTLGNPAVLHAGDPAEEALVDYLAFGAASVEVLPVPAGHDIVPALVERLGGFELVLCGSRSEAGEFSGMLPYLLAARLMLPVVSAALEVTVADGAAEILQFLPKGRRRRVKVRLPAVIAVHPMAPRLPRYAYARRVSGKIVPQPIQVTTAPPIAWRTEPATHRPQKFKAPETRRGHARMLSAIATASKGGVIISNGTPIEKARIILDYLRTHRLIDF